jgi:hypothetical protein
VPTVTPEKRDLPGIGPVTTYNFEGQMAGPDGTAKPFKINSHDASIAVLPYEKALELQRKGTADDNKAAYQGGLLDLKGKQIEAATETSLARIAQAQAKTGQGPSREERLRYTSLFSEAGRRMQDAQKALTKLNSDIMYSTAKPGSTQAQEMQDLRDSIKSYKEERDTYGSLLAGSQTAPDVAATSPAKPSLANAKPAAAPSKPGKAAATPPVPTSQAEYDALPKGAKYIRNGEPYVKN